MLSVAISKSNSGVEFLIQHVLPKAPQTKRDHSSTFSHEHLTNFFFRLCLCIAEDKYARARRHHKQRARYYSVLTTLPSFKRAVRRDKQALRDPRALTYLARPELQM